VTSLNEEPKKASDGGGLSGSAAWTQTPAVEGSQIEKNLFPADLCGPCYLAHALVTQEGQKVVHIRSIGLDSKFGQTTVNY
jgi:hypothetical protein